MKAIPSQLAAEIDEISLWMFPSGSQKKVAQLAKVTEGFVSMVMAKKKKPTPEVLKAARQVMAENRARFEIPHLMKAS